ncbi:MAG TPA: ferritin-like domain-containing protein [Chitinophagales bacterium]|nr:ferritin-like domain-containing protein [Chitinophagales bacterium]
MELLEKDLKKMGRLSFLKYSGLAVASSAIIMQSSCKKDDDNTEGINLGSGDTGILNYAYALEQLEAAFYTQVMASPYSGITAAESQILSDLQKHEVAHREFFKAALGGNAIVSLEVDFSMIDFTSRTSVLNTAKAFEDLGVSAYNGAGKLLVSSDYLLLAGKIVSVEARHAAAIRDLISPNTASFAGNDVVDTQGLDGAKTPAEVLGIAGTYLKSKINASNLPTS